MAITDFLLYVPKVAYLLRPLTEANLEHGTIVRIKKDSRINDEMKAYLYNITDIYDDGTIRVKTSHAWDGISMRRKINNFESVFDNAPERFNYSVKIAIESVKERHPSIRNFFYKATPVPKDRRGTQAKQINAIERMVSASTRLAIKNLVASAKRAQEQRLGLKTK